MKVFITGIYGSGKTFLANKIAKEKNIPFISLDEHIDYQMKQDQFDWLMSLVPQDFVMDAIPFDDKFTWNKFLRYQEKHNCQIICCYCPDKEKWIERIKHKEKSNSLINRAIRRLRIILTIGKVSPKRALTLTGRSCERFIKNGLSKKIVSKKLRTNEVEDSVDIHYSNYNEYMLERIPELLEMQNVKWFDSIANEYTSLEEAMKRINIEHIDSI